MMFEWTRRRRGAGGVCALAAGGLLLARAAIAQTSEFRAYWADAFHAGFRSSAEVTALINDARAGNFNAVVVEVRKRGDAYYNSNFEPKAGDVSPSSFDPLADLIAKGHDTSSGEARIEIHAWLVTYPIWGSTDPGTAPANHPVRLHPDWLNRDNAGNLVSGNYFFDPGHPAVQQHTFNVAMDIASRYDVDGVNFDYIRYPGNTWGYNTNAVQRFNAQLGRVGAPASSDPAWLQFRREQVTALLRKVYLHTLALKPGLKVSADTITWSPGPTSETSWTNTSSAFTSVLQDWKGWMQEGILDLNIPMAYFDQAGSYTLAWTNWNNFAKDHRYNRHLVLGPGIYLNSAANAITQIRYTRVASPAGNTADGVCAYSYAVPDKDGVPRAAFHLALITNGVSAYDSRAPGAFAQRATPPPMPWKTTPTQGHLLGFACGGTTNHPLDGATITLTGPVNRTQMSDATGFYGFVDLTPGAYSVAATMPGLGTATNAATIVIAAVTTVNLLIGTNDATAPVISNVAATDISDASATITWTTDEQADSVVEYGPTTAYGTAVTNTTLVLSHALTLPGLSVNTPYHYRVRSKDAAGNQATSPDSVFTTLPVGTVSDLIIDDAAAAVVGSWTSTAAYPGYYGPGYRYKGAGSGSQYVEFRPTIPVAGTYRVYTWYVQGGNRTTDGPHLITDRDGLATVVVNQQINGSQWLLLGSFNFAAGTGGYVRITDAFTTGSVVMADAVKFVFVPAPPLITAQPQSQTVKAGSNVTFTVTATGTAPLTYQWRCNSVGIAGATTSNYALVAGRTNDASPYSVVVSNVAGAVVSSNALLTVLPPAPARFQSITRLADGRLSLVISGDPGVSGALDISTNLSDWLPLAGFFNTNGLFEFTDPAATNSPQRFYRTRQ